MAKRALLLVNRHARKGQKNFAQAVDALNTLDFELFTAPLKDPQSLPKLVQQYQEQIDVVIVGGGDGTLNAVVDALVEAQLPLGVIPLGTANDLARTLHIPLTIPEACRVIANGKLQAIDLGWVNGKYFFNVASLGLSVSMTERLSKGAKQRWGVLAYALAAAQVLGQTRSFPAEIRQAGQSTSVHTIQIAVGNGRYYGGGMAVADDATIDDQRLDVYSLELQHWWQVFPLLFTLPKGQHDSHPWVRSLRCQDVEILTPQHAYAINTDGELTRSTPARFRVVPKALRVFVPSG
jgi:YegS/Rv2252/BmrU family lipid kinase